MRLQVNKLYPAKQHQIPGEDMYLEEGSPRGSYASAPEGHIIAVVDPEVSAMDRLHAMIVNRLTIAHS